MSFIALESVLKALYSRSQPFDTMPQQDLTQFWQPHAISQATEFPIPSQAFDFPVPLQTFNFSVPSPAIDFSMPLQAIGFAVPLHSSEARRPNQPSLPTQSIGQRRRRQSNIAKRQTNKRRRTSKTRFQRTNILPAASQGVSLEIFHMFRSLHNVQMSFVQFTAMCAYLFTIRRWGADLASSQFDLWITQYETFLALGIDSLSYPHWFLTCVDSNMTLGVTAPLLTEVDLEQIKTEQRYTFSMVRKCLERIVDGAEDD